MSQGERAMYTFFKIDDGFHVFRGDRAVAMVTCVKVEQSIDSKLKDPVKTVRTMLARDYWTVHFCAGKPCVDELRALLAELSLHEFEL
jgi:hypothetical protein